MKLQHQADVLNRSNTNEKHDPEQNAISEDSEQSEIPPADADSKKNSRPDPTRFGDWEKNGRCIDF